MLKHQPDKPGTLFKKLYHQKTITLPGVYDAISALAAKKSGAEAIYITGAGVTNSSLAVPDIALLTLSELANQTTNIVNIAQIPAISDADTGFGETMNVKRTVQMLEHSGLAGIHIEDQANPKRCGHLDGKSLIDIKHMQTKLRAALDSRKDPDFHIIARTDARSVEGLDEAIERANIYVKEGADIIFPEGLYNLDEFKRFRDHVHAPLLANMTEFGKTPLTTVEEFSTIGYELVIFPMTAFRMMLKVLIETYEEILNSGTQKELIHKMYTRKELYDLIEYEEYNKLDVRFSK